MRRLSLPHNHHTKIAEPPAKSRYNEDFDEIESLGKGAYGSVFKVRNKLDSLYYAVKKISFKSSSSNLNEKILREVKTLASLNHPNVVRYHSAWLEEDGSLHNLFDGKQKSPEIPVMIKQVERDDYDLHSSFDDSIFEHDDHEEHDNDSEESDGHEDEHDDQEQDVIFWDEDSYSHDQDMSDMEQFNQFDFDNEDFVQKQFFPFSSSSSSSNIKNTRQTSKSATICRNVQKKRKRRTGTNHYFTSMATLFIVMQLYTTTLSEWLDNRHSHEHVDPNQNRDIFRQICQGLKCIHSKNIIHRDLKPGNIFLASAHDNSAQQNGVTGPLSSAKPGELLVSLGDFGLAIQNTPSSSPSHSPLPEPSFLRVCASTSVSPLARSVSDFGASILSSSASAVLETSSFLESKKRTTAIGTLTYASPEQRLDQDYNEKTDVYSLGIIFFELYHPFSTKMERARVLEDLRNHIIPDHFVKRYPAESAFIKRMMASDPNERPTVNDLLSSELLDDFVTVGRKEFRELEERIQEKDSKIKEQEDLIKMLREQLRQSNSNSIKSISTDNFSNFFFESPVNLS